MGMGEFGGNLRSAARCILHVLAFLAVALFPKRGGHLRMCECVSMQHARGYGGRGEECMVYEPCTRLVAAPMPLPPGAGLVGVMFCAVLYRWPLVAS